MGWVALKQINNLNFKISDLDTTVGTRKYVNSFSMLRLSHLLRNAQNQAINLGDTMPPTREQLVDHRQDI